MEQAAAMPRPRLDEDSASKVIGAILGGTGRHPHAHLLRSDWRHFMREAFELTPEQHHELVALDREEAQKIQGAFMAALDAGGEITLRVEEPAKLEIRLREVAADPEEGGERSLKRKDDEIGVGTIFHCHTAKRLRDWVCHWGPPEEPPGPPPPPPPSGPLQP